MLLLLLQLFLVSLCTCKSLAVPCKGVNKGGNPMSAFPVPSKACLCTVCCSPMSVIAASAGLSSVGVPCAPHAAAAGVLAPCRQCEVPWLQA